LPDCCALPLVPFPLDAEPCVLLPCGADEVEPFVPFVPFEIVEPLVPFVVLEEFDEPLVPLMPELEVDPFVPDMLEVELVSLVPDVVDDEPLVFSAARVCESSCPEACRPCFCWNCFSADFVFGPSFPSTGPALKPWSLSACWIWVTWELSPWEDDCCEETFALDEYGEL